MTTIEFKKAERVAAPFHLGATGPAKAGKSLSSLALMRGLIGPEGRMAVLDTEGGSINLYANNPQYPEIGDFDVVTINQPFSYDKYLAFLDAAVEAGYDGVIFDSVSHAWAASGGVLERRDEIVAEMEAHGKKGGEFAGWGPAKKPHLDFIDRLLHAPIHTICTWRLKLDYTLENVGGKQVVRKLGLGPVQQPEFEYEFDIVFVIDHPSHEVIRVDNRAGLFENVAPFKITVKTGQSLKEWRDTGSPWVEPIRDSTKSAITKYFKALGIVSPKEYLTIREFQTDFLNMTEKEAAKILNAVKADLKAKEAVTK